MDNIKEAIAYIAQLAVEAEKPEQIQINGRTYCTKNLTRYDRPDMAEPIKATTLTALIEYIKESREELRDRMIIQVVNPTKVLLYSGLLAADGGVWESQALENVRSYLIEALKDIPDREKLTIIA